MTARRVGVDESESEEDTFEIVSYETVTATVAKKIELHEKQAALQLKAITKLKQKRPEERSYHPFIVTNEY